jgi:hypothetical protein
MARHYTGSARESVTNAPSYVDAKSKRSINSAVYIDLRRLDTLPDDQYGARDFEGVLNIFV